VASAAPPAPRARLLPAPRARAALLLAAPVAAALLLRTLCVEPVEVGSSSMSPTLEPGDRLFVNKLATPRRGDVVVFERGGARYVKRIVGLPGERVEVCGSSVRVNGVAAEAWRTGTLRVDAAGRALGGRRERLGGVEHEVLDDLAARRADSETLVPAGHYFVLGDNRDHSADSRDLGPIAREEIVGVAAHWLGAGPRFEAPRPDGE
jgi:signal peptidase I